MDFRRAFRPALVARWVGSAAGLLGCDCVLCGTRSAALACASCAGALPRPGPSCPRCALPMPHAETCARCLRRAPAFDAAMSAFEYAFPVDRLVRRFKYAGDLAVGRWLALALAAHVRDGPRPDLLVVPPLTRARLATRGFNQALVLARAIGGALDIPVEARALERMRETRPQPGLRRRERDANLRGALRCRLALAGRSVAVVDDVMTTGATAEAMARALKHAGAGRVAIWVVARTPAARR